MKGTITFKDIIGFRLLFFCFFSFDSAVERIHVYNRCYNDACQTRSPFLIFNSRFRFEKTVPPQSTNTHIRFACILFGMMWSPKCVQFHWSTCAFRFGGVGHDFISHFHLYVAPEWFFSARRWFRQLQLLSIIELTQPYDTHILPTTIYSIQSQFRTLFFFIQPK